MNTTSQPQNTSCVKKVDLKCKCFDAGNVKRLLSSCTGVILVRLYSGVSRDKTIHYKLMYIPNYDKHNYPSCTLQLLVIIF